jgi:hypothetical protein
MFCIIGFHIALKDKDVVVESSKQVFFRERSKYHLYVNFMSSNYSTKALRKWNSRLYRNSHTEGALGRSPVGVNRIHRNYDRKVVDPDRADQVGS